MCGISLIIDKSNNHIDVTQIRAMNDKVVHRGPDDEGYYYGSNFAFGHRRLCILDLTLAGHQPMARDNFCINYNGEIYNYLELIDELKKLGHHFKTHADTEVLLPAYWEWGVNAFNKFNGMWAFMLYDATSQEIILCRDRFGVKPLYYTVSGNYFMAASEIKQFTAIDNFKPTLNSETALNFLSKGWLNYSEKTFFEDVYELKPGHYMIYDLKSHEFRIQEWYDLRKAIVPIEADEKSAIAKVYELLGDSIKLRMRADVQVGSCLSGGIDSSSIVTYIHKKALASHNFKTITSCYTDQLYDEQEYSDAVTRKTGFKAVKVYPDLDQLLNGGLLDKMIYQHDQPFSGASHFSEFNVFRAARENGIIVLLDGQGADEAFGGYDEFFITYVGRQFRRLKFRKALRNLRNRARTQQSSVSSQWNVFLRTTVGYPLLGAAKRILGRTEYPWLAGAWKKIAKKQIEDFPAADIESLSLQQVLHSSLPYQLHSADRNSMFFSIEVREPFMDYRLIEYVIGLPDKLKFKNGYSKTLLREAMQDLPPEVKNRSQKMGFVAPDKKWILENKEKIRSELQSAIENMNLFSEDLVLRFEKFAEGKLGYEPIYFRAIALNHFCSIFKMQPSK